MNLTDAVSILIFPDIKGLSRILPRDAHEELTTKVATFLQSEGFETFTLSTESCDLCDGRASAKPAGNDGALS